jgi:DNA-binding transcriptional LysR family regulator
LAFSQSSSLQSTQSMMPPFAKDSARRLMESSESGICAGNAGPMCRIVRAFRTRDPDAQISIRSGLSRDVRRFVADGISDVGFVSRPVKSPELDYHRLFSYEHVLITPPGHPLLDLSEVTLGDIARWPLILTQPGRLTRELLEPSFAGWATITTW